MLFISLGIVAIDKIAVSADYRPYMPLQRSKSIIIWLKLKRRIRANIRQIEVYKNEL